MFNVEKVTQEQIIKEMTREFMATFSTYEKMESSDLGFESFVAAMLGLAKVKGLSKEQTIDIVTKLANRYLD